MERTVRVSGERIVRERLTFPDHFQGDSTIYAHEGGTDAPHLFLLTHHKCTTVYQLCVSVFPFFLVICDYLTLSSLCHL